MGTSPEVHGRTRTGRITRVQSVTPLLALLLLAAFGCGGQPAGKKSASTQSGGDSKATTGAGTTRGSKSGTAPAAGSAARTASGPNVVHLTQKTCVQLEPHWSNLHAGQSLTWRSDLKSTVTVHVAAGAFDKTTYVVRAGASVSTGPARTPGSYSIWTEPAACQGVPLGVHGSGPGLTVEGPVRR